jgi:hypothetical protein
MSAKESFLNEQFFLVRMEGVYNEIYALLTNPTVGNASLEPILGLYLSKEIIEGNQALARKRSNKELSPLENEINEGDNYYRRQLENGFFILLRSFRNTKTVRDIAEEIKDNIGGNILPPSDPRSVDYSPYKPKDAPNAYSFISLSLPLATKEQLQSRLLEYFAKFGPELEDLIEPVVHHRSFVF